MLNNWPNQLTLSDRDKRTNTTSTSAKQSFKHNFSDSKHFMVSRIPSVEQQNIKWKAYMQNLKIQVILIPKANFIIYIISSSVDVSDSCDIYTLLKK
ncbi:hypothetical protein JHK82_026501 [Glycine max]|uniref:Uncharacterized protein n=2 Tax=Glycine subgen. Soja TaxID=1462606 RepID=A0A0R0HYK5_SOYBN|nr:hypothetical protein JHK87_026391 [Glycine soja]KAG4995677.1 hypothetical protein JHK85_027116 [Glycine max]KAG5002484.1 hypothetical protein JHK86_026623 [Glycine max]KAG5125666.1 hypothetical protein JHK82_026501 [Glycine max]KAG5150265.1 hypothetical protein JHK84_026737 [Glycine max]